MSPMMCGGISQADHADEKIQELCYSVKDNVEAKLDLKYDIFRAMTYSRQIVAGTNYFIKVDVGGDDCIHIRVFEPLPHTGEDLKVHSVQRGKKHTDPVEYFDKDQ